MALDSRRQSKRLALAIAERLQPSDLVLLSGGLGSGKTFVTRAIARARGVPEARHVTSPTFGLVQEYDTPLGLLVHADLYRILDSSRGIDREVEALGLREYREGGAICLVEWGESVSPSVFGGEPELRLMLETTGSHSRIARLSGPRALALQ